MANVSMVDERGLVDRMATGTMYAPEDVMTMHETRHDVVRMSETGACVGRVDRLGSTT